MMDVFADVVVAVIAVAVTIVTLYTQEVRSNRKKESDDERR